jgi:hypothetical protein
MEITPYEIEVVMEYWNDITQDVEVISSETGMDMDKVKHILSKLQGEEKIENFRIDESVDPETGKILKVRHFGSDYNFSKKRIDRVYDSIIFNIEVKSMEAGNEQVIFECLVNFKHRQIPFYMVYDIEENVYYGSPEGKDTVTELRKSLGDNIEMFDQTTFKIISDLIPEDYWEGKIKQN